MKNLGNTRKIALKTEKHQLFVKLLELEQKLESSIKSDQTLYEDETFKSRQFSKIQKYIRMLRKAPVFPYELYLAEEKAKNESEKKLNSLFDFSKVFLIPRLAGARSVIPIA